MFQGAGSDVGKSLIVAGLCRACRRRGLRVLPFKPQNMSNNAAVTADGGEIGRAQALQARASGVPPSVHMNPVLLKPQSEVGAQVVVLGRIQGSAKAREYQSLKPRLLETVLESFRRLRSEADIVLVEGAGSPAEVNLRAGDIANMGFARAARTPVVLIGDIDRGGVIASLVGTLEVIDPADREMIAGYVVNKFRGDVSLFDEGLRFITERTGRPSLGVVPFFDQASALPAEDGVALERRATAAKSGGIKISVLRLARIANFDDFDPLAAEPAVDLQFVDPGSPIPGDADLVVIPGSKATIPDLEDLRRQGWDVDIQAHLRRGGRVLGICGGFQMLGRRLHDPDGMEGPAQSVDGLGALDLETTMTGDKTLVEAQGRDLATGEAVTGYEMHIGRTVGPDETRPMLSLDGRSGAHGDGAVSKDGLTAGCYLHGLFSSDGFRAAYLASLGKDFEAGPAYQARVEGALDALAEHLERHLDVERILQLAGAPA